MIKTLVIDDEPLALQQLAAYVRKIPFLDLVAECQSAIEARDIINNERIDAIFVDINMPDMNGMDFVRSLAALLPSLPTLMQLSMQPRRYLTQVLPFTVEYLPTTSRYSSRPSIES